MTDNVKKIIAFFLLGFLSLVGNALNVELFFGARLVFSSVFVIIALFTLGPWYGVGVAFFGGLYTIVLWQHPFAFIIYVAEAVFFAFTASRLNRNTSLIAWDFVFWAIIGIPLTFVLFSIFLELSFSTIALIAFKETLNGLINVLIASLLLILGRKYFLKTPWIQKGASVWSISALALTFIVFLVFIPSSITLHYFSEKDFNQKINYLSKMTENKAILARAEFEHLLWDKTREQIFTKNLLLEKDVTKYTKLKILESGTAYDGAGNFKFNFIPEIDPQFSTNQIDDAVYHYALNVLESSTSNLSAVHSETFQIFGFDGHIYSVLKSSTDNQLLIFKWNLEKIIFYLNNSAGDNSQVRFNVILEGDRSKQHSEYESSKDYAGLGVFLPKNSSEGKLLQWINAVFCREVKIGVNDKITITALLPARKMILDQQQDIAKDILLIITFLSATMIISIWLRRWIAKLTFHLAMEIQRIEKQHGSRSEYMRSSLVYELRWISVWLAKLHQRVKYRTAELEKSLYDHQQLIDLANAPIFGIDAEGRVNEWNQMAEQITGFAKDEVMGQDLVGNHITDDYKKSVQDVLDKALNGEQTANFEFPLFSKTGERIDVLLNSTTRRDSDGKIIGVVGVGQDITELNKVRVEQEQVAIELAQLLNTANVPMFGIDAKGCVNEWNDATAEITSLTKNEVLNKNFVGNYITDDYKKSVQDVFDKALNGEQTANFEFPLFSKTGERIDVLLNSTTRRDSDGKIIGVVGVGQDITELNKVRVEQDRIANDLTQLIDTANAPIFGIDAEGRVNEWNQTAERITGFTKDEVIGENLVAEYITDDYKKPVKEVLDKALAGEQTANYEFPLFTNSGDRVDVLLNSTTRRDSDGKITGVVGVGQDITELNKVRVEQDRIANDLTQLIDTANAPIFGIDAEGRVNEWNQTAERITGFTKDEVIGKNLVAEYITDDYKKPVKEVLDKALAGEQTANYEFPLFTNSGDRVDVLLNSTTRRDSDGKITGVVGVGQDITELNKVRVEQDRIANDLTQLIDTANAPIFGIDAEGRVNEWNQTAERITGFTKDEVIGENLVAEYITDDYKKPVKEVLDKALAGEQTANYEFPLFTNSGDRVDVLLNFTTRRDSDGKITGVVGVGQDITELNKVRVEQDRIANDLTQLIDTANAPIFGIDAEGRVNEWNQTAERITGFTKDEVIGKNLVAEYITDDFKESVKEVLDKALAGEQTANYEFPLFTNSGDRVDVLLNFTTRRDSDGKITGVVGVGQDITELKKSQAQVIHSSKLATLGEMATSVAHELNQPLNVIRLAAGNCRLRIDPDSTYLVEKLSRIEEQTARAALIIDHMKMFGRKTDEKPSNINVHEVIQSTFDLVGEQIRLAGINLREKKRCSSSKEHEIFVIGHEIQLEQVFINLITNARDALQTRGRSLKEITIEIVESLESIQIKIFDTGGGIPEKVIDQIFHPFFTTKEVSKGTGLGLSISYGIITDMGGSLECCNWEEGACFSIILPKAKIDEPLPRIKSGDAK
ncbi:sensory box sensor histidine kinase [Rhodobacterales bacterium HTCC2150]|nr:sensory box sensor histidine kinase [Rhodobacterales bacterium HTCC2150] [Rhodobacteraceae bacterium HTCC2150]